MCGIAGLYAYLDVAPRVSTDELARMNLRMEARGPDGSGDWISSNGRVGFTHRRLAIIDLSERGAQPMHSTDGQISITFNGEIYNYRELKAELEAKGRVFRSDSDTEVLLQLYEERGDAMVEALRGMFAFGLWDGRRKRLLMARDPLGIKPLYYADDGWTVRFATLAKALLAGGAVSATPDPAGIVGFHLFGSVPEPFTVWRGIRAVPAGATVVVDATGPHEPRTYYDVAAALTARAEASLRDPQRAREMLRAAVHDSVRHHLVADVPVAVFLSAGLDSGALLGTMAEIGVRDTVAVTLSFDEFEGQSQDEAPLAAEVAKRYGARHIVRRVTRAEFEQDLPAFLQEMDLPTTDGINTWFVAKAAREAGVKVALSGLGADECFGGYPSFTDVPRSVHWLAPMRFLPGVGAAARRVISWAGLGLHPKAAGVLEYGSDWAGAYLLRRGVYMPWELDGLLDRDVLREGLRRLAPLSYIAHALQSGERLGDFDKVAALETSLYMRNQLLRDSDWAGMAHGIEIRVPYVDPVFLAALPPGDVLAALNAKAAVADVPVPGLPPSVRNRAKTGFATPVGRWIAEASGAPRSQSGQNSSPHDFSAASRAWASRVWKAGWTTPITQPAE